MHVKSRAFVLKKPYEFYEADRDHEGIASWAAVKPTLISICAADIRYYTGFRRTQALREKLPMVLVHEGIGKVVRPAGQLRRGDRVVIVPAVPGYIHSPEAFPSKRECCPGCADESIGENHCRNIRFLSSNCDGICQTLLQHPPECLINVPEDVPDDVAVMSELLTVAYNAVKGLTLRDGDGIVIFGDGPVGYVVALVLRHFRDVPRENLHVYGLNDEKLARFDSATAHNAACDPLPDDAFACAFECVGGIYSHDAIVSATKALQTGGTLLLFGVSELEVPINTREILEKRIVMKGVSRSARQDYPPVLQKLGDTAFQEAVRRLIHPHIFDVTNVESLKEAFDFVAEKKHWGKILLHLNAS